jgi:hypothetical protein
MRWPKTTVGPIYLWLPRLLLGVGVCFDLVETSERLLYTDHMRRVWLRAICGLSMESVWCVDQVFPCRVYIDSNLLDMSIACLW